MDKETAEQLLFDQKHLWHPYTSIYNPLEVYMVESADGVRLLLKDGSELIDGMAPWWSVIHGYNNPQLTKLIQSQVEKLSHVMFGGLTHEPAIKLAQLLIDIGKTITTGLLARSCLKNGVQAITQKIVQTGCVGLSEDIIRHRQIMEIELQPADFFRFHLSLCLSGAMLATSGRQTGRPDD